MKPGQGWFQWGVIWRIGAIVAVGGSFLYMVVRAVWDFDASFEEDLRNNGYSAEITIEEGTASMGPGKSQELYIARTKVGGCLLRLERKQFENGYTLTEVNGHSIDYPEDSPSKAQTLTFLATQGYNCSG